MAESVDVAIIGGGIAGASAAYFLAQQGVRNVLVLERSAVAAGASGRASGVVSFLAVNHPGQAALLKASRDFYHAWEWHVGGGEALHRAGGVWLANASERAALEREVGVMQGAGHDTRVIERAELADMLPDWDLTGIDVAAYSPGSGFIDPPMVTTALMNRARALGVRVYQGAEVMAIRVVGGRVEGVESNRGRVAAPVVVIAAGAWSARVGQLIGARLEVWPVRHMVMHLKPPARMRMPIPSCTDPHNSVYFRTEPGGLVMAANAGPDNYPDEPPGDPDGFDPTAAAWYSGWVVGHLSRRIPAMRDAEIVGGHAGVYAKSSDSFPLLGPMREADGLYCLCDTGGGGMTTSPGLGRALAETIVHGSTFTDARPFRPSRFAEDDPIAVAHRHEGARAAPSWT